MKAMHLRHLAAALTLAAAALLLAGVQAPAHAQSDAMQAPTIAVIDMRAIMNESKAVQDIQGQINQQRSSFQKELSEQEKQLREQDKALAKQRTILPKNEFEEKRNELRQRLGGLQRNIQQKKKQLDQQYSDAMQRVQNQLIKIVRNIASEQNVDIVMNKASLVLVRSEMEITKTALQRLNQQLPSVDVSGLQN